MKSPAQCAAPNPEVCCLACHALPGPRFAAARHERRGAWCPAAQRKEMAARQGGSSARKHETKATEKELRRGAALNRVRQLNKARLAEAGQRHGERGVVKGRGVRGEV
ncbi:hypothetical protein Droror1_Dr00023204 [Drosera rotundifolia]